MIAFLKKIAAQVGKLPAKYGWSAGTIFILTIVFFALGTGYLLSIGPSLQLYLYSLLKSPEPSIYSSAYGDSLVRMPAIGDWLFNTGLYLFGLLSSPFFLIVAIKKIRAPRDMLIVAVLYFSFALTAVDVYSAYATRNSANPINLPECIVANIIGSLLIGGCIILVRRVADEIRQYSQNHTYTLRAIGIIFPTALGFLVSAAAYYVIAIFFSPTSANLDATVSIPISGFYASTNGEKSSLSKKDLDQTPFQIISDGNDLNGNLTAISAKGITALNWTNPAGSQTFKAEIRLYSGCPDKDSILKAEKSEKPLVIDNVTSFSVTTDNGPSQSYAFSQDKTKSQISVSNSKIDMYSLTGNAKGTTMKFGRYLSGDSLISFWNSSGNIEGYLSTFLFKMDESKTVRSYARSLAISINGKTYNAKFKPDESFRLNSKFKCQQIDARGLETGDMATFDSFSGIGGVSVQIKPASPPTSISFDHKNALQIKGVQGWVSVDGLTAADAALLTKQGHIKAFSFQGDVRSLRLNDKKIDTAPFNTFYVMAGDMQGALEPNGQFHFYGTANAVFKDQTRLTQTRWEKLDTTIKMSLLAGAATALASLFLFAANILRKNDQFSGIL